MMNIMNFKNFSKFFKKSNFNIRNFSSMMQINNRFDIYNIENFKKIDDNSMNNINTIEDYAIDMVQIIPNNTDILKNTNDDIKSEEKIISVDLKGRNSKAPKRVNFLYNFLNLLG